jgi:hypothetical protein
METLLFFLGERSRVEHKHRVIRIDHENDLQQAAGFGRPPNEVLFIALSK